MTQTQAILEAVETFGRATYDLVRTHAELNRLSAQQRIAPKTVLCPACEVGDHETAELCGYHVAFQCECNCSPVHELKPGRVHVKGAR